jgi:hypothetical protein
VDSQAGAAEQVEVVVAGAGAGGARAVGGGATAGEVGGGLGAAGGLEGVTVTGTAGGGLGTGGAIGAGAAGGLASGMPSQEQILNNYDQEQQGSLAQQPSPQVQGSGFDWNKLLQQQQGAASSNRHRAPLKAYRSSRNSLR